MADVSGFDAGQLQTLSIAMMKGWVRNKGLTVAGRRKHSGRELSQL